MLWCAIIQHIEQGARQATFWDFHSAQHQCHKTHSKALHDYHHHHHHQINFCSLFNTFYTFYMSAPTSPPPLKPSTVLLLFESELRKVIKLDFHSKFDHSVDDMGQRWARWTLDSFIVFEEEEKYNMSHVGEWNPLSFFNCGWGNLCK